MKTIQLTQGKVALVDDSDFDQVAKFRWFAIPGKRTWYATRNEKTESGYRQQKMEKFLIPGVPMLDHRDRDGLNNQRGNLRAATVKQNASNRRKIRGASSKFRGVTWYKGSSKWRAQLEADERHISLGLHHSEVEAARAYDAAAKQAFGEFANLNFPA